MGMRYRRFFPVLTKRPRSKYTGILYTIEQISQAYCFASSNSRVHTASMKKSLLIVLLIAVCAFPLRTLAVSTDETYRAALANLVELLLRHVALLKAQLAEQLAHEIQIDNRIPSVNELMASQFYDGPYTALYAVRGTTLFPIGESRPVSTDEELWQGFVRLAGNSFVKSHIQEFRIYSSPAADYDAFAELDPKTGRWILAVNKNGVDISSDEMWTELNQLFVHEMGHIAISESMFNSFSDEFWDESDLRHARRVEEGTTAELRDEIVARYYSAHESDFVTEYAAMSPLEDAVESFTAYAIGRPAYHRGLRAEKIRFFERYQITRELRAQIQDSL